MQDTQLHLNFRNIMNNFLYRYVPCNIWVILIKEFVIYLKFKYNRAPVFYLATFIWEASSPVCEAGVHCLCSRIWAKIQSQKLKGVRRHLVFLLPGGVVFPAQCPSARRPSCSRECCIYVTSTGVPPLGTISFILSSWQGDLAPFR